MFTVYALEGVIRPCSNHLFFSSVFNKKDIKTSEKCMLVDASQIRTPSPSGNTEDFMCVYEHGMFIAR